MFICLKINQVFRTIPQGFQNCPPRKLQGFQNCHPSQKNQRAKSKGVQGRTSEDRRSSSARQREALKTAVVEYRRYRRASSSPNLIAKSDSLGSSPKIMSDFAGTGGRLASDEKPDLAEERWRSEPKFLKEVENGGRARDSSKEKQI